jgi:hypothetical protein
VIDARSQSNTPSASAAKPGSLADSAPETAAHAAKSAYLARAEKLVLDEREASNNRVFSIWMKPIPERVTSGHAIEGIQITDTAPDGGMRLSCWLRKARGWSLPSPTGPSATRSIGWARSRR